MQISTLNESKTFDTHIKCMIENQLYYCILYIYVTTY